MKTKNAVCDAMRYATSALLFALLICKASGAGSPAGDVVGKVVVGYQGWFSCTGDGSPLNSWGHMNLEMWPDVREYTDTYSGCPFYQDSIVQPGFTGNLGNGAPAKMFSSYSVQTVNTHVLWMQQNGIDCAALQIFGSDVKGGALQAFHMGIAQRLMIAAQTYGRKFYIMYDCSATDPVDSNWTRVMVDSLHVTSSSAYAVQNGKPVVCMWGVGKSGRGAVADWVTKINRFKALGCYVIGGVISGFRSDTVMTEYKACDMIMPWMVGRNSATPLPYFESWYKGDLAYCDSNDLDYQADIYPGSAFYNTDGASSPKNLIPRMHGDFMWSQFAAARSEGVQSVYISMFDEANEATSIFKVAENASMIPAGEYFLTLDADGVACSSDFYLRLTNDGGKMVKGQIAYTDTLPTPHEIASHIDQRSRINGLPETRSDQAISEMNVFDVAGRCVMATGDLKGMPLDACERTVFPASSVASRRGVYLVRFKTADNAVYLQRIVR